MLKTTTRKCPNGNCTCGADVLFYIVSFNAFQGVNVSSLASQNSPASTVLLCEGTGNTANVTLPDDSSNGTTNAFQGSCSTDGADYTRSNGSLDTGPMGNPAATTTGMDTNFMDTNFMTGRHTSGSEFLLCDGHVEYLKGVQVSPGVTANAPGDVQGAGGSHRAAGTPALGGTPGFAATFSPA